MAFKYQTIWWLDNVLSLLYLVFTSSKKVLQWKLIAARCTLLYSLVTFPHNVDFAMLVVCRSSPYLSTRRARSFSSTYGIASLDAGTKLICAFCSEMLYVLCGRWTVSWGQFHKWLCTPTPNCWEAFYWRKSWAKGTKVWRRAWNSLWNRSLKFGFILNFACNYISFWIFVHKAFFSWL